MKKLFLLGMFVFSHMAYSGQYDYLLYQKDSDIDLALRFIGAPSEQIPALITRVRGNLAKQELIDFSNKIIEARETNNVDLFTSFVDKESLEKSKNMFNVTLDKIKDGSLIYGNEGHKYFVTSNNVLDRILNRYFKDYKNKPSITLMFYHYHKSNGVLIGSPTYLIKTNEGYKNVIPILGKQN